MGKETHSRDIYEAAVKSFTVDGKAATERGEQHVRKTGKLNPLVDPAEYGVVRESRIRLEQRPDGLWMVTVGTPIPTEYRLDTTTSMGDNTDRALTALPTTCDLMAQVLPERDPFYCASVFGDICDPFVLCRGQFEVLSDRMVDQLTLMNPERGGGDIPEDPHYGLFGAAYLTRAYLQQIGLRSYDHTITDAPMHDRLIDDQLVRIFGPQVFEKAKENGYDINKHDLPTNKELVGDLLKRVHAFVLLVNAHRDSRLVQHWAAYFGKERVVVLSQTEHVPYVMATITGLTEGTIDLRSAKDFLAGANLTSTEAQRIIDSVAHIPLGAQRALPNYGRMPQKGDIFVKRTDLWPMNPDEIPQDAGTDKSTPDTDGGWL